MKPACRYGPSCNKLQTGQCNFYHPRSHINGSFSNKFSNRQHYQDNYQQYFQKTNTRHIQPSHPLQQQQHFKMAQQQPENVLRQLCREYHYGVDCRFGGSQTCKKKHNFVITQQQKLKRIYFKRIVNSSAVKLTKFESNCQTYEVLRMGNQISFYVYNHEMSSFNEIYHYVLPVTSNKYLFYDHKNQYIYYSCDNAQTACTDIGYYNLEHKQHYYIANSHVGKVTGMAHCSEHTLLSTCTNGELKLWTKNQDQLFLNAELTDQLRNTYNPNNNKIELLFLDLQLVNDVQIFTVGTNDGRLFFFFGEQLSFNEIAFDAKLYVNY